MPSQKRRQYTAEFRYEAVRLITEQGCGVTEAARNLGINAHMLGRWKRQLAQQNNGGYSEVAILFRTHGDKDKRSF